MGLYFLRFFYVPCYSAYIEFRYNKYHATRNTMPTPLTKAAFDNLLQAKQSAIIDAYATWCGPCVRIAPIFEKLEQELRDKYIFAKFDVDTEHELAVALQLTSIPTFIFVKQGNIVAKEAGLSSEAAIRDAIRKHL